MRTRRVEVPIHLILWPSAHRSGATCFWMKSRNWLKVIRGFFGALTAICSSVWKDRLFACKGTLLGAKAA